MNRGKKIITRSDLRAARNALYSLSRSVGSIAAYARIDENFYGAMEMVRVRIIETAGFLDRFEVLELSKDADSRQC